MKPPFLTKRRPFPDGWGILLRSLYGILAQITVNSAGWQARTGIPTVAWDIDPSAVEQDYLRVRSENEKNLLPLMLDLTNPSPALGWENKERDSLSQRGPVDAIFALALIHHLAISNNIPLTRLVDFFSGLCRWLVIEWVPKTDSQVQKLLRTRKDIFTKYNIEGFESEFGRRFQILDKVSLNQSDRVLYLLEIKS